MAKLPQTDWEFVERPPEELQSECPLCLAHLREPYQVTCCGYSFCQACIEKVKKLKNGACPCCKAEEYYVFPNKGLKQSLYSYKVYCSHQKEGCPWIGSLGEQEGHLNLNPSLEAELDGCQFVKVQCSYSCSKLVLRSELKVHKTKNCLQRPYSCEYCNSYDSTYGDVIYHWSQCGHYLTRCPQCGVLIQRQALDNHTTNDCPETMIDCDFKHFGCDMKLPRKYLVKHINENSALHMRCMSLLVMKLEVENKQLKEKVAEQQLQQGELHVRQDLRCTQSNTPSAVFNNMTMDDLESRTTSADPWVSPSFYVHGYNLCLQVYVNTHGVNTDSLCTMVFICLKKGRFDDHIRWPFEGEVTVEMLKDDNNGRYEVLHTRKIVHKSERVVTGNLSYGRGVTAVHPYLMTHVTNNRLHFRVPAVQLMNTN